MVSVRKYSQLAGRIITGLFYLQAAVHHFTDVSGLASYAALKGVPQPTLSVILTGGLLLIAGVSILVGYRIEIAVLVLVVFYIPVTFMMHNFWAVPEAQRVTQTISFMKNMALMGSALMWLAVPPPWSLSLEEKLRVGRS